MFPAAVALLAAVAYGAGVITTALVAANVNQPSGAGQAAPITRSVETHRIVWGPNEY
jgi:hypothetical protein